MRSLSWLALAAATLFLSASAHGATLNVVGGQLLGASNVDVGGTLYNVEFVDGTCIGLFEGCDDQSDFAFHTREDAHLASQALLDQVFLDVPQGMSFLPFDTDPERTVGCESTTSCQVFTPYLLTASTTTVRVEYATNTSSADYLYPSASPPLAMYKTDDTAPPDSGAPFEVWAVWTDVPEPGTALLMAVGLVGLGALRRQSATR